MYVDVRTAAKYRETTLVFCYKGLFIPWRKGRAVATSRRLLSRLAHRAAAQILERSAYVNQDPMPACLSFKQSPTPRTPQPASRHSCERFACLTRSLRLPGPSSRPFGPFNLGGYERTIANFFFVVIFFLVFVLACLHYLPCLTEYFRLQLVECSDLDCEEECAIREHSIRCSFPISFLFRLQLLTHVLSLTLCAPR